MFTRSLRRRDRRPGAALVEFALVASIAFLFFFGILEYARFVFFLNLTNNAAREGTRFAIVHTGDGTTTEQVIEHVTSYMSGRETDLHSYAVEVLAVNPDTGETISGRPWNEAGFGDAIAIRISGNYSPIVPGLLLTAESLPIRVQAMMSSEAN